MKIIEKNEGKKINYNLTGTKLDFAWKSPRGSTPKP